MIFNRNRIKILFMMKMYKKLYLNFWVFLKKNLVLKFLLRNYNALILVIFIVFIRGLMNFF